MLSSSAKKNSTTVRSQNTLRLTKAALQTAYAFSEDLGGSFAERLFTSPRRYARPAREREVLASARRGSLAVTLRSPRWHGETVSIPTWRWGHGPTVLLVHGWEGRGSQLGAFVAPLVRAGLSVLTFDAPGHGDSSEHRLYLTDLADTIADVVGSLDEPLHGVIAHSFGAAGILLAAVRNDVRIARNVLISPNVIVDDSLARFSRLLGLDDVDRAVFEQRIVEHSGIRLDSLKLETLVAGRDERLLIVHDHDDREVSIDQAQRLSALWPNAELITTSELGHRRILRDDATIAAAVDALSEGLAIPASDLVREVDRQLGDLK